MERRLKLHDELKSILGSNNVYFQPPETVKMIYPCILYERSNIDTKHADNKIYNHRDLYTVTYIDRNPDSPIPDTLLYGFQMISFDRSYKADNLNHDVFSLYY